MNLLFSNRLEDVAHNSRYIGVICSNSSEILLNFLCHFFILSNFFLITLSSEILEETAKVEAAYSLLNRFFKPKMAFRLLDLSHVFFLFVCIFTLFSFFPFFLSRTSHHIETRSNPIWLIWRHFSEIYTTKEVGRRCCIRRVTAAGSLVKVTRERECVDIV